MILRRSIWRSFWTIDVKNELHMKFDIADALFHCYVAVHDQRWLDEFLQNDL